MKYIILFLFPLNLFAQVEFSKFFANKVPPSFHMSAAYVEIENNSEKPITFNKIKSDCAEVTEFHDVIEEEGMSKMVHMNSIIIKPKQKYQFFRGGRHIMLIKLKKQFFKSNQCKITLTSTQNKTFSFTAKAEER